LKRHFRQPSWLMPLMTLIRLITPFSLRHWLFADAAYAIDVTPLPIDNATP
jgi:hypothetical protein